MSLSYPKAPATHRRLAILAWVLAISGLVVAALVVVGWLRSMSDAATADDIIGSLTLLGSLIAFLLSGALIASRQPRNIIGWLLLVPGVAVPLSELGNAWLAGLDPVPTTTTPGLWIVLWFCGWSWLCLIFPIFHLLLTFPDGRLPSPRWRWIVAIEVAMISLFVATVTFSAELMALVDGTPVWSVANPIGFLSSADIWDATFSVPWEIGLLTLTIGSVAAFVVRFRRGSPEARHQLKWPMAAIVLFGVVYGAGATGSAFSDTGIWNVLFGVAIAAIPVSVAVAVLKYRLYEIDRIISRTLGWAVVTGVLLAVFALGVIGLQAMLSGFTQGQTLAVAASTLAAFALFQPLRRRVQHAVDRRFDRARYDGSFTADEFATRVRDEVDIDAVVGDFGATVGDAMRPRAVGIWLREGRR
jgi:hypothetical protein